MKKFAIILLCIMMLLIAAVPALAAEETKITVTASKDFLQRGEEVTFTINISGDVPYTSVMVGLEFDKAVLEFVSSKENSDLGGAMLIPYTPAAEEIGLLRMSPGAFTGTLQELTFKVKDDAPLDTVAITGVKPQGSNEGTAIVVEFEGTSITIGCEHNYGDWTKVDEDTHQQVCTKCQAVQTDEHDWEVVEDGVKKPGCETPGELPYSCLMCSATKVEVWEATGHAWDNACDPECNNQCGTTREITHLYDTTLSSDETGHWYACQICQDKMAFAAHVPGPAATEKNDQVCTACAYVIEKALVHVHNFADEWTTDEEQHWHVCRNGDCTDKGNLEDHVYQDDCSAQCSVCGYTRVAPHYYAMEWRGNSQGHWQTCMACNAQSQVYDHVPGPAATQDTPQVCQECNFWIQFPLSHVHEFGDVWQKDEKAHWRTCQGCLEADEMESHIWNEGVIQIQPTATEEGSICYTCTVCGWEETQVLPPPAPQGPGQSGDTTGPNVPTNPTTPTGNDGFPWWIVAAAAGLLLLVGIILLIAEWIRSRKTNMHGKFSK